MNRDELRDTELLEQLEQIIILERTHYTLIAGHDLKFLCLSEHIREANNRIGNPYGVEELRIVTRHIKRFFRRMERNRWERTLCLDLVDYINIVREASDITRYED